MPDAAADGFELDARLAADCLILGQLGSSRLLLMNNSLLPWFILVPATGETEIYKLPVKQQLRLLEEINLLSDFVNNEFAVEKLNVAAIGNIVRQLHVHVVGRSSSDYCWPGVVWGADQSNPYTDAGVQRIRDLLETRLKERIELLP